MKRFRIVAYFAITIFACLTLGFGLLTFANPTSVHAEVKCLTVKPSDFTVETFMATGVYYKIVLRYDGENESGLPQANSQRYQERNVGLTTDDEDILNMEYLAANGNSHLLALHFRLNDSSDGKLGYTAASPTEICIPKGSRFTSSEILSVLLYPAINYTLLFIIRFLYLYLFHNIGFDNVALFDIVGRLCTSAVYRNASCVTCFVCDSTALY